MATADSMGGDYGQPPAGPVASSSGGLRAQSSQVRTGWNGRVVGWSPSGVGLALHLRCPDWATAWHLSLNPVVPHPTLCSPCSPSLTHWRGRTLLRRKAAPTRCLPPPRATPPGRASSPRATRSDRDPHLS